jgi:hypothetical protein
MIHMHVLLPAGEMYDLADSPKNDQVSYLVLQRRGGGAKVAGKSLNTCQPIAEPNFSRR